MATIEDASMPDAVNVDTIDFSDGVLGWLHTNRQILEEKVARQQTLYTIEEWETFERWALSHIRKLEWTHRELQATEHKMRIMQWQMERMKSERTTLMARIATLEEGQTFSSMPGNYRTGMLAIEKLVYNATIDDGEWTLLPARDDELIMDRFNALVGRMAHVENRRVVEATDVPRGGLLANRAMYDLLYFN